MNKKRIKETTKKCIKKLLPAFQRENPMIFIVYMGSIILTVMFLLSIYNKVERKIDTLLFLVMIFLWLIVICANFIEVAGEDVNLPKAKTLKQVKGTSRCRKLRGFCDRDGCLIDSSAITRGDIILVKSGEKIPFDGQVIEGIAEVDESEIEGEKTIHTKTFAGDDSFVTGGSVVVSGEIVMKVTASNGEGLLDEMIHNIESSRRKRVNSRVVLESLLILLTSIFIFMSIGFYFIDGFPVKIAAKDGAVSILLIAILLFSLCPVIGAVLTSITEKLTIKSLEENKIRVNSINTVEAMGKVDVAFIEKSLIANKDKRKVKDFITIGDIYIDELVQAVSLAIYKDESFEGKLIGKTIIERYGVIKWDEEVKAVIPFKQNTAISGVNLKGREIRKGAPWAIREYLDKQRSCYSEECNRVVREVSKKGDTPIVVCDNEKILGIIVIEDEINCEAVKFVEKLKEMKVKPVFISGGSSLTTLAIAKKIGIDSFLAQSTLERKMKLLKKYQESGYTVVVTGNKNIDAPVLAKADIGISTNIATVAAREACNLEVASAKNLKIVEVITNCRKLLKAKKRIQYAAAIIELIKYIAIIPILFSSVFPELKDFLIINLKNVENIIVALILYNIISLMILIPLAYIFIKKIGINQIIY